MSQPSPAPVGAPPVYAYVNPKVVRPPLGRAARSRVWIAGALANLVLSAGLLIVTLAGILLLIALIMGFVSFAASQSSPSMVDSPFDYLLRGFGLDEGQAWILWTGLVIALLLGLAVCAAGVWVGEAILASAGIDRPWAVATSATGILLGAGLVCSSVLSPLTAPLMAIVFGAVLAGGAVTGEDQQGIVIALLLSIVGTVVAVAVYLVAGALVWWWMAHALRRPGIPA